MKKLYTLIFVFALGLSASAAPVDTLTWDGSKNTNWFDTANWTPSGLPDSTKSVVIPVNKHPQVPSTGANVFMRNLLLNTGSSLTLNNKLDTFVITGDMTNNGGTFTTADSTLVVFFNRALRRQYIKGTKKVRMFALGIGNPAGLELQLQVEIVGGVGVYDFSSLTTNGNLKLLADPLKGAAVIVELVNGASVSGNVTIQQYLPSIGSSTRDWAQFSAPVVTTLADLKNELPLYGFPGALPSSNTSNTYFYDEPTGSYKSATNITNPMGKGKGWQIYVFNFRPLFIDFTGPIHQGTVTYPVSFTPTSSGGGGGFNLVGNPYPAVLDWGSSVGWTKTNISQTIYFYNPALGQYATYDHSTGTSTNGGSRYIAVGQGIYVEATGSSPLLRSTEQTKVIQFSKFLQEETRNRLSIDAKSATGSDETIVLVSDIAHELNPRSVRKFRGRSLLLATSDGQNMLSTNYSVEPAQGTQLTIPLHLQQAEEGTVQLSFSGITTFDEGYTFYLEDLAEGTRTLIEEGSTIDLAISAQEGDWKMGATEGTMEARYNLVAVRAAAETVGVAEAVTTTQLKVYPSPAVAGGTFQIQLDAPTQGSAELLDMQGRVISTQAVSGISTITLTAPHQVGIYTVRLRGGALPVYATVVVQ